MTIAINFYDSFLELLGDGSLDMDGDTFKIILLDQNFTFDGSDTDYSDVSGDELSTANGYTNGGQALSNVSWSQTGGVVTFDFDDVTWSASGGAITAYHAVIYDDTSTNDKLICAIDFDGEQSAGNGTAFKITIDSAGLFSISRAA